MVSMLKVLLDTALDLQTAFNKRLEPIVSKLSRCMASLPDEVLALIFNFAGHLDGTKQAVRLSHVSRRFRAVALGERRLWTMLHSNTSKDGLATFIARGGRDADLYIIFHINSEYFNVRNFLDVCWPTAPRWRWLTVSEHDGLPLRTPTIDAVLKMISSGSPEQQLIRLEGIDITSHRASSPRGVNFENHEGGGGFSWTSPNFSVLRSWQYVPSPSPAFVSVTTFDFSIHLASDSYGAHTSDLLLFLASAHNIRDVSLLISTNGVFDVRQEEAIQLAHCICPSITSLKLVLSNFLIRQHGNNFLGRS